MKIAIVGSQTFPVIRCAPAIATQIATLPKDTIVVSRGAEGFDRFATECARIMNYEVEVHPGRGGALNFERDYKMAQECDELWAFFDPDLIGQGGTQHVVDKFLDAKKPVRSYTSFDRNLVLVGSDDGNAE